MKGTEYKHRFLPNISVVIFNKKEVENKQPDKPKKIKQPKEKKEFHFHHYCVEKTIFSASKLK